MTDRTSKFLLAVIASLLIALLVRPTAFSLTAAQAQDGSAAAQTPSQMIVDKNVVYVLQGGKLSVYHVEKGGQWDGADPYQRVSLRRVAMQDVAKP